MDNVERRNQHLGMLDLTWAKTEDDLKASPHRARGPRARAQAS
jgi:hypothetical protein